MGRRGSDGPAVARLGGLRLLAGLLVGLVLVSGCSGSSEPADGGNAGPAQSLDAPSETTTTTVFTPPERIVMGEWRPEHWMEDLAPQIGGLPLSELRIPGTHDAGSASIPREAPVLSPAQGDAGTEQFEGIPPERIADYILTQGLGLTEQLDQGVRYLDLRLTCDPDGMFIVHVFRGMPIEQALEEVASWAEAHPREVLFLDVQKDYGCADQRYDVGGTSVTGVDRFTQLVRDTFAERLAPRPPDADTVTTLDQLVGAGTNVVTFFIDLRTPSRCPSTGCAPAGSCLRAPAW